MPHVGLALSAACYQSRDVTLAARMLPSCLASPLRRRPGAGRRLWRCCSDATVACGGATAACGSQARSSAALPADGARVHRRFLYKSRAYVYTPPVARTEQALGAACAPSRAARGAVHPPHCSLKAPGRRKRPAARTRVTRQPLKAACFSFGDSLLS